MRRSTISMAMFESGLFRACPAKTKSPVLSFSKLAQDCDRPRGHSQERRRR
jgi:hypothetical protein